MEIQFTGAISDGNGKCRFSVWAPEKEKVMLRLGKSAIPMEKNASGYFITEADNVSNGTKYFFQVDDSEELPDPCSYYQPDGVHEASAVVDHNEFQWTDGSWRGVSSSRLILYELHIGTFTDAGTFESAIEKLDHLVELGVTAIELMPVNQFPGNRNWGYDGVFPYAVQNSYGGPNGLKKFVDACHAKGLAAFVDVVYNHLGPEGNYLSKFGPYFTSQYKTPWGDAINFDGEWSDGVREYFANNALYWFKHFHLDGLRLDAVHMVFDNGAVHFWQYLNEKVKMLEQEVGRKLHMIAESDLNSPKIIDSTEGNGYGFTGQWLDDFHHALYVMLDRKGKERYYDFGSIHQLAKACKDGFVHSGEYVKFRKRKHGASSAGINGSKFVVFNLNHDQIGNRPDGKRLCLLVTDDALKVAAAAIMLSPYIPMLFMGEEYADRSPFYYFVSHSDKQLIEAVRNGRKEEFKEYGDFEPPDAQSEKTFNESKLDWSKRELKEHRIILEWHKKLISLRKEIPTLTNFNKNDLTVHVEQDSGLLMLRHDGNEQHYLVVAMNFSSEPLSFTLPSFKSNWNKLLDSNEAQFVLNGHKRILPHRLEAGAKLQLEGMSVGVYAAS